MKNITTNQCIYIKESKTFIADGKKIQFDTSYTITNPKTKGEMKFDFTESTGSEWDPKTLWIYKSEEGFTLNLTNEDVTPEHAEAYLKAKLFK
jgi:Na+-transporting NADH:ubiquinone oxidoreductase subunit NqrF